MGETAAKHRPNSTAISAAFGGNIGDVAGVVSGGTDAPICKAPGSNPRFRAGLLRVAETCRNGFCSWRASILALLMIKYSSYEV